MTVTNCDMGGTSFDITLTKDGQTNLNKNSDLLRYCIGVPMTQVETLGAGAAVAGLPIIEEVTATIVIKPGWTVKLDQSGAYVITK
jgi:N-methylhydantoinase A/oxoprolinase/acetone carboxylase beta subunit